jgi:hypothetical protein
MGPSPEAGSLALASAVYSFEQYFTVFAVRRRRPRMDPSPEAVARLSAPVFYSSLQSYTFYSIILQCFTMFGNGLYCHTVFQVFAMLSFYLFSISRRLPCQGNRPVICLQRKARVAVTCPFVARRLRCEQTLFHLLRASRPLMVNTWNRPWMANRLLKANGRDP